MATGQHQASQGLLLFQLNERQSFGIGTLKVKEIVPFQPLTRITNNGEQKRKKTIKDPEIEIGPKEQQQNTRNNREQEK